MSVATPQKLKETIIRKEFQVWKESGDRHKLRWGPPGTKVSMCLDRAKLITESYKQTEGEPEVIRRAKALSYILSNMKIYIRDGEQIVGNFASDPAKLPIMPELSVNWLEERLKGEWHDILTEKEHAEFQDIADYWRDRCIDGRVMGIIPKYLKPWITYRDNGGIVSADEFRMDRCWLAFDYGKVIRIGLSGVIKEINNKLNKLQADMPEGTKVNERVEQIHNLKAMAIACEGAITFASRFAKLAQKMSKEEQNQDRKAELEVIASNCRTVPQYPASTLHEALQCWWFIYLIGCMIETTRHGCPCRLDQLMYPIYKKELEEGKISRERAKELFEYLMVKIEETGQIAVPSYFVAGSGVSMYHKFTIGGTDEYGEDASNEFSLIMLDAAMEMRLCQPTLALRYHPKLNPVVLSKVIDCIRAGLGYPDIFNDIRVVNSLVNRGVPLKVARNWCNTACVSWNLPAKNTQNRIPQGAYIALGKCLELALNQGRDMRSSKQLGYATPDPVTFKSVDDVMSAYLQQVNFVMDKVAKINNLALEIYKRYGQLPFASALLDGGIERGADCTSWTEYPYHQVVYCGIINVADSLAAMKKIVFDEKSLSMAKLLEVLKSNFEGYEDIRQQLLGAPKFGNDDDYVDYIARDVYHKTKAEIEKFVDIWGYPWTLDGSIAGGYYATGRATWALPDGKREGRIEAYADGTLSPMPGRDKKGPTAVIRSMGKVDIPCSPTANQRFMPQFLEGANKDIFAAYLKTWAELGNWEIQFNVVDTKTLRDAQKHPERYSNLIVRVAGYSAYFTDLPKTMQDEIISRTAQSFA